MYWKGGPLPNVQQVAKVGRQCCGNKLTSANKSSGNSQRLRADSRIASAATGYAPANEVGKSCEHSTSGALQEHTT